jgi:hypothetical protein
MGKKYVSERELSEYSGIAVRTLQGWRMRNQGPPWRKFCGTVRYDLVAFESWASGQPGGGGIGEVQRVA